MDNIINLLRERKLAEAENKPVYPDEVAQIVITHGHNYSLQSILRYKTLKKAQAQYDRLCKLWYDAVISSKRSGPTEFVHDMYSTVIDPSTIQAINLIDWRSYDKFKSR